MNRSLWETLVVQNPMLIEIQRFRRRFLSFTGPNAANGAVLVLVLIFYVSLVMMVVNSDGGLAPSVVIGVQTGLFTLLAPGMLHGAIAGERERRSWDLLLAAPITKAQIVVGKFIGALTALGIGALLFLLPLVIAAATYKTKSLVDVLEMEAVSLSFTMAVCALTVLLSARARRPFMALGATLGVLAVALIVAPMLLGISIGFSDQMSGDLLYYLHPYYTIWKIHAVAERPYDSGGYIAGYAWGLPQTLIYLGLTAVMVAWAANTLNFAENEVKFIPKGQKNDA